MCGEYQDDASIPPPEIFLSSIPRGLPRQETSGHEHRKKKSLLIKTNWPWVKPISCELNLESGIYFEKTNKFYSCFLVTITIFVEFLALVSVPVFILQRKIHKGGEIYTLAGSI